MLASVKMRGKSSFKFVAGIPVRLISTPTRASPHYLNTNTLFSNVHIKYVNVTSKLFIVHLAFRRICRISNF